MPIDTAPPPQFGPVHLAAMSPPQRSRTLGADLDIITEQLFPMHLVFNGKTPEARGFLFCLLLLFLFFMLMLILSFGSFMITQFKVKGLNPFKTEKTNRLLSCTV